MNVNENNQTLDQILNGKNRKVIYCRLKVVSPIKRFPPIKAQSINFQSFNHFILSYSYTCEQTKTDIFLFYRRVFILCPLIIFVFAQQHRKSKNLSSDMRCPI